ncbi:DTBP1 protein, partial [Polypterus senegalus]
MNYINKFTKDTRPAKVCCDHLHQSAWTLSRTVKIQAAPACPDGASHPTEITLQVPSQAELRHKLSSLSSTCTDSASQDASEEGGDSPVVQSDEEEVQVDALLAMPESAFLKENSDDSDSQAA